MRFRPKLTSQKIFEKNLFLEKVLFQPFTNAYRTSLFGKNEFFLFFIDKNLQRRRMTNLKLGKDSPDPEEHPRYPESMSGVPGKDFLSIFQKSYFFEKAFFEVKNRPNTY